MTGKPGDQKVQQQAAEDSESLQSYNIHDFDVPLTTVDIAILTMKDAQLQVLLVKRDQLPHKDRWALPGGFIDLNKDKVLLDTARRKLFEKTGVSTPYLEQVATIGDAERDPRGWSVTVVYLALLPWSSIQPESVDLPANRIGLFSVNALNLQELAFDHAQILKTCLERLQSRVFYTSIPVNLLPEQFTLSELQQVYELILGKPIEKKSFRRRIQDANILEETGQLKSGGQRPAKLYRARPEGLQHIFPRTLEGVRSGDA